MIKVGNLIFDTKKNEERKANYRDVKYDADKWVDATKFLPADFDLVYLKVFGRERDVAGWINGDKWDGLNFKPEYKVLQWKRYE